jgi:hypothetical protein
VFPLHRRSTHAPVNNIYTERVTIELQQWFSRAGVCMQPLLAQVPHFNGRMIRETHANLTKYSLHMIAGHTHKRE